jgi:hypothetical protein
MVAARLAGLGGRGIAMDSESARMSSAEQAKFRIDRPNSKPRAIKVIALDRRSEHVVKELAGLAWQNASFLTASAFAGLPAEASGAGRFSLGGWLNDLAGRAKDLIAEVASADLVVMVASASETAAKSPGDNAAAAALIGEACQLRHVMTTALILGSEGTSDQALSAMLALLRPHVMMLVVSSADEYIKDMLTALRA